MVYWCVSSDYGDLYYSDCACLLRQSRNVFLADLLHRLMEQQLRAMEAMRREYVEKIVKDAMPEEVSLWVDIMGRLTASWMTAFRGAFSKIDERWAKKLTALSEQCSK